VPDRDAEAWLVELRVPPEQMVLFQGLLCGEDGLAVLRCRDPERRLQQLWITRAQRQAVRDWLQSLPAQLDIKVIDERPWSEGE